jgi:hypothetical protein
MRGSITIRFTHEADDWRVMCHASSGRCFIWRNGSFLRSTTYVPRRGLTDHAGLVPSVVPQLLDRLVHHDPAIEAAQRMLEP